MEACLSSTARVRFHFRTNIVIIVIISIITPTFPIVFFVKLCKLNYLFLNFALLGGVPDYPSRTVESNSLRLFWNFSISCLIYIHINNIKFTYDKFKTGKFRFSVFDIFSQIYSNSISVRKFSILLLCIHVIIISKSVRIICIWNELILPHVYNGFMILAMIIKLLTRSRYIIYAKFSAIYLYILYAYIFLLHRTWILHVEVSTYYICIFILNLYISLQRIPTNSSPVYKSSRAIL